MLEHDTAQNNRNLWVGYQQHASTGHQGRRQHDSLQGLQSGLMQSLILQ